MSYTKPESCGMQQESGEDQLDACLRNPRDGAREIAEQMSKNLPLHQSYCAKLDKLLDMVTKMTEDVTVYTTPSKVDKTGAADQGKSLGGRFGRCRCKVCLRKNNL